MSNCDWDLTCYCPHCREVVNIYFTHPWPVSGVSLHDKCNQAVLRGNEANIKYLEDALAAALATPSTAGERYAAMERVCRVAEDNRRIEYPRELIEALDELAALEKGNG